MNGVISNKIRYESKYENWVGGVELGREIWLAPVVEHCFGGLRGEEQKNGGRNTCTSSKADIEYSIQRSQVGDFPAQEIVQCCLKQK